MRILSVITKTACKQSGHSLHVSVGDDNAVLSIT